MRAAALWRASAVVALAENLGVCPRCRAIYEPDQEYCLECGLRLPRPQGAITTLERAWKRRLPWYPGDWIWPALVLLLIAAAGGAIAYLATREHHSRETIVATTQKATPRTTPRTGRVTWPAGKSGYTAVLQSIPRSAGRRKALALVKRAIGAGLTRVGYLNSARFSSLHPGYYVVFSGVFDSSAAAQSNVTRAASKGFSSAYAHQITP